MLAVRAPQIDRAWRFVAVAFVITMVSTGLSFAIGPLVSPLLADFGLTRTYLSGVIAVRQLAYGVGLAMFGRLADRWGTRPVAVGGAVLIGASLVLAAATRSVLLFSVSFGLLAPAGFAAVGHTVLATIISRWFKRRRGLALTFLSSGAMGGIALGTPLLALGISYIGWRGAYMAAAAACMLVFLPVVFFGLREPRVSPAEQASGTAWAPGENGSSWPTALRSRSFWLLGGSFFACGFSMNLLSAHGVPMLEEHGFTSMTASMGIGLIGFVSIFGSLALGAISDRWGRPSVLALIYGGRALGFLALFLAAREWELYLVTATAGLVWAGSSSLTSALTADLFGAQRVGTLFGWMYLLHQIGGAIASYLGGWAFTVLGSFTLPFGLSAMVLFAAAFMSFRVARSRPGLITGREAYSTD